MGKCNSSSSRAQAIFGALYEADPSGEGWVKSLLDMATGNDSYISPATGICLGQLVKPPQFGFPIDPSKRYLKWLIEHPEQLSSPPAKTWRHWDERKQKLRSRLLLGDKEVQAKAIRDIVRSRSPCQRAWWRLEGATYVDCALFTQSTAIFVEAEGAKIRSSKDLLWYQHRNAIHRNLDCAAAYAQEKSLQYYFVIAIVDRNLMERDLVPRRETDAVTSPEVVCRSLPHLNTAEREEIMRHYGGMTTWEDMIQCFGPKE